jgi:hypothetical protein
MEVLAESLGLASEKLKGQSCVHESSHGPFFAGLGNFPAVFVLFWDQTPNFEMSTAEP